MSRDPSALVELLVLGPAFAASMFDNPPPKKRPANPVKKAARKRQRRARAITRAHR